MASIPKFPCPCCGFVVFAQPVGSYEICPLCDWEDDPVQLMFPALGGGANHFSLFEAQSRALRAAAPEVQLYRGFVRHPAWRPLRPEEAQPRPDQPDTGRHYFEAIPYDGPKYYWE